MPASGTARFSHAPFQTMTAPASTGRQESGMRYVRELGIKKASVLKTKIETTVHGPAGEKRRMLSRDE